MAPDDLAPTPELLAAVKIECDRVRSLIDDLKNRRTDLLDELQLVDNRLRIATSRYQQLGHVLGVDDPQPQLWEPAVQDILTGQLDAGAEDRMLRGAAIRQALVRAALADHEPGRPRHYREWLDMVEAHATRKVDGRDPAATLLTQMSRCPLFVRAAGPGMYQLDAGALARLTRRRDELCAQAAAHVAAVTDQNGDAITLARTLAQIEAEVRRIERSMAEAADLVEALGAENFFRSSPGGSVQVANAA